MSFDGCRTDILILFLNQDPNLLRGYVVRPEGSPLLGLLVCNSFMVYFFNALTLRFTIRIFIFNRYIKFKLVYLLSLAFIVKCKRLVYLSVLLNYSRFAM